MTVKNVHGNPVNYSAMVVLMDNELREELHEKLSPCSDQEFFEAYAKAHKEKFGEDFAPFVGGNW